MHFLCSFFKEVYMDEEKEKEIIVVNSDNIESYADQIQLDTLLSTVSVQDIYDTYGIDRAGLMKVVSELRRRGNNIRLFKIPVPNQLNTMADYIKNYGHIQLQKTGEYRIENNDPEIKVMFASDLRYGSRSEQPTIFNEMCATAK